MKVRVQAWQRSAWSEPSEWEVVRTGKQVVYARPGDDALCCTFLRSDGYLRGRRRLRIHPDDMPRIHSLPAMRVVVPEALDLNAHPMADVLREVVAAADVIPPGTPIERSLRGTEGATPSHAIYVRRAALCLAGLAALAAQKGSA